MTIELHHCHEKASREMFIPARPVQLRSTTPTHKARAESSSQTSQSNECQQTENHRGHHHEGEASGGLCKVQEGLDFGSGIACGRLLNFLHHFVSQLTPFVKEGDGQRLENSEHTEKQQAADGAEPGSGSGPDNNA